jgi:hypothetical protein
VHRSTTIAAYGCVRASAERLGLEDDAALLQQTLDEEAATDEMLTELAERMINSQATEGDSATVAWSSSSFNACFARSNLPYNDVPCASMSTDTTRAIL